MSKDYSFEEVAAGCFGALFALAIAAFIVIYGVFSSGFVLSVLWAWFLLPLFPMLPKLTVLQAIGLMLVVRAFKPNYRETTEAVMKVGNKVESKEALVSSVSILLVPWFALLLGWFIRFFFM